MDKTTATLIGFGLLVLAFIAFFAVFRKKGTGEINGPFGMGLKVGGDNEPQSQPGVQLKDAQAGGSIRAADGTGRGLSAEKLKATGDIDVSSSSGPPPKP
jgi:hypothetical protein